LIVGYIDLPYPKTSKWSISEHAVVVVFFFFFLQFCCLATLATIDRRI
jgi:hypothetical protein